MEEKQNDKTIIFIDQSGFNLHLRRILGRSIRVYTVTTILFTTRGTNASLISAISKNEVLYSNTYTGSINAQKFIEYINLLIEVCRNKSILNSCVLILDNAKIHHAIITKNFLEEKNLNVKFLSPYSYMLNPIELSFSKIKANVRRILA